MANQTDFSCSDEPECAGGSECADEPACSDEPECADGFACSSALSALEVAAAPVNHPAFDQFVATIAALRAPDGCPWDREQTHGSIAHNMIEEAYEAVDAIESHDVAHLREELGDVLLQVVLQSQIASDAGEFTIDDVCADVNEKMVRRHPHVFGDAVAENANEVLGLWDQVKLAERLGTEQTAAAQLTAGQPQGERPQSQSWFAQREEAKGLFDGVPASFPALMQAQKISRKAAAVGFEWDTLDDVWEKVREEAAELNEAYAAAAKTSDGKVTKGENEQSGQMSAVEMEFGDMLFALVNVARRMGIDAESALRASCGKFRKRWAGMERAAFASGTRVESLTTAEQNDLWNQVKEGEA